MTKYTEEVDLIKSVLGHIKNVVYKGTFKWKDGNTLIFTSKTKIEEGKIVFKDKDITITGKKIDDLFKNYKAIYKNAEKNKVKPSDITGTALSKLLSSTSKFGGLEMNPTVVKQLNAEFKKFGIKDIVMEGNKTQNNTLSTNLTLFISTNPDGCGTSMSSGWVGRLRTFLFDEFEHNNKNKDEINIREINKFKPLEGEKPILMTYKGTTLGYYFPERNLIHLLFNPFILNTQSVFAETYSRNWDYIFAMFSEAKVKKNDISKIQEKLFISEFMKNSRNRLENVKNSQASTKRDIVSYENKIMGKIEEYSTLCSEEDFLQQLIDNKGKGLFEEIDKVKKLPFVVKLDIESSEINVKFRETFMPIPDMIRHDSGKSFGKRYIWIGGIGFKISAGNFSVYGDVDVHNSHFIRIQVDFHKEALALVQEMVEIKYMNY